MKYNKNEWEPWFQMVDRVILQSDLHRLISQTNPKYRILVWLALEFVRWTNLYGSIDAFRIKQLYEAEYKKVVG